MFLFRSARVSVCLGVVLGLALLATPSLGDDKAATPAKATPQVVRLVYTARGGSAKELANALIPHFKTEPSFLILPGAGSKTLLLSGPKAIVQEAVALLKEIDRPARTIRVEILLVELTNKAAGGAELSGPVRDVMTKIIDLEQRGGIAGVHRVELTVLERDSVSLQSGENKPYVTGMTGSRAFAGGGPGGGPGPVSRSLTYRNVGTSVHVIKPEIGSDGQIELLVHVEDAKMRTPGAGPDVGTDEKGTPVAATEFVSTNLEARLRIPPGHFVVAESTQVSSKAGHGQKIILVGALTK